MLEFKRIENINDIAKIKKYIESTDTYFSTLSLASFLIWRRLYPREYCILNDTLILREFNPSGQIKSHFFMPVGKDVEGAIKEIEVFCRQNSAPLIFANLTKPEAEKLGSRYESTDMFYDRTWSDYIYLSEDMCTFSGKKFSGQRNHINKFKKLFGKWEYNEITAQNKDSVKTFLERLMDEKEFSTETEKEEFTRVLEVMDNLEFFGLSGGFVAVGENIVAMSLGEVRGDTLFVCVEKADRSYPGAYQVMVKEFANHYALGRAKYINREDDMGLPGLRTSKMQYHPIEIRHKYYLHAKTLMDKIISPVEIAGERIVINDIKDDDAQSYFNLCSDKENNKLWGYDYSEDKNFKDTPDYYMGFFKKLKDSGEEYALAIRYEGNLCGEIVFHNFDFSLGVEIGIRLLPEFQGKGLATEAVVCATEFLKEIGAKQITMKCYIENTASYNMIKRAGFTQTGKNDTHIFFKQMR